MKACRIFALSVGGRSKAVRWKCYGEELEVWEYNFNLGISNPVSFKVAKEGKGSETMYVVRRIIKDEVANEIVREEILAYVTELESALGFCEDFCQRALNRFFDCGKGGEK
ncbi:MAG: hypothetical protein SPI35_06005 [Porphyromonas sp.]|nr:hypothetical protein [Porphyromonas sp.]